MYSAAQILKGIRNPGMALEELNRVYYSAINTSGYNDGGVHIFDEDWDNMIILDACRYDYFERQSDLPGTLEKRESLASMTHEWVSANFTDRELYETVYISANGQFLNAKDRHGAEVHEFVGLFGDSYRDGSGEGKFVPPDVVTEHALEASEKFPNKRHLIHYLQPHNPYLGPSGEDFEYHSSLHKTVTRSPVTEATLQDAYRENLDIVLDEVETLIQELPGKTIVTADHGEFVGEREFPIPLKRYGHPRGIYAKELVEIPWLEFHNGERREVVAEYTQSDIEYDEEEVKEHLRDIGYAV